MTNLAHQLRRALARARAGKALSIDETEAVLSARGEGLRDLMAVAGSLRDLGHGRAITYSRKVFIPLTMLCRDHCHYCTFAKPPAKLEKPFRKFHKRACQNGGTPAASSIKRLPVSPRHFKIDMLRLRHRK